MSKYKSIPTVVDNIIFQSKKEAARYQELRLLARAGYVTNLELQVPFQIEVNGHKICKYIADFRYSCPDGKVIVEDVKGMQSGPAYQMFRLKAKLMEACYRIRVLEV